MSNFSALLPNLGYQADSASATGSAQAKLAQLLAYIESTALFEGSQVLPVIYPNLASPASIVSGATAGTYGSYVDIVAANVLTGHSLVGLLLKGASSPVGTWSVDIAEGAAGSEVVKWRSGYSNYSGDINTMDSIMPDWFFPGYKVTANARISARCTNSTNNALTMGVWGIFAPRPY